MANSRDLKGQGSLEYVMLLTFTIVFFIIIVSVASDQLSIVGKQQRKQQAQFSLKQIADAATDVYQQGSGAKSVISVTFPSGVDPGSGYVINNSLHISFEGSDITNTLGFPVSGVIPGSPGGYTLLISSQGGAVSIGTVPFIISPTSLAFTFCANPAQQSSSQTLVYSNNQNTSTPVQIITNWANGSANMSFSPSAFNISFGGNQSVTVNMTVAANTAGTFSGVLFSNTTNYTTATPISVTVQSCGGGNGTLSNVSSVIVRTYKDSTYTVQKTAFGPVENVTATGTGWTSSSAITVNVTNSSGSPMPGYPKTVMTNSSGEFTDVFNPFGLPSGTYTVSANQSSTAKTHTFTLRGCS